MAQWNIFKSFIPTYHLHHNILKGSLDTNHEL